MRRLNQKGVIHHILPLFVIAGIAIVGVYQLVTSNAETLKPTIISNCSNSKPYLTPNNTFPLSQPIVYQGQPNGFEGYGYGIIKPRGYKAENHIVFTNNGTVIKGYLDPKNAQIKQALMAIGITPPAKIPGVVGAGFDIDNGGSTDTTYGGFDVCFSMSRGNWQNVELIILAWPTDNNFSEGEIDMFEGNPQGMLMHIHEIGSNPTINAWNGTWPKALSATGPHLISARWDPSDGYLFYLDHRLVVKVPVKGNVSMVYSPHRLSVSLRDTSIHSKNKVAATIYWSATYNYNSGH